MSEIITRNPKDEEMPLLLSIWDEVFGSIGMDAFFRHYYNSKQCIIAEAQGMLVAMGHLVPFGAIIKDEESISCAMVYAIATLPEYRRKGLGAAVVNSLIRLSYEFGYSAVVLCPTEDSLFEYYSKNTPFRKWFYVCEVSAADYCVSPCENNMESKSDKPLYNLEDVSPAEYGKLREKMLDGTLHIKHDIDCLNYQKMLCDELGGGLYRIGDSYAVVEVQPNEAVWVKELLIPSDTKGSDATKAAVEAIAAKFPTHELILRFPANRDESQKHNNLFKDSKYNRRFGMLAIQCGHKGSDNNNILPWYGLAFE